jgi:hypothetical protein
VKLLLQLYLIVAPVVALAVKDMWPTWPASWPNAWLLIIAGLVHAFLVACYGLLEWGDGNRVWTKAEVEGPLFAPREVTTDGKSARPAR